MQELVGTDASPNTSAEDAGAGNLQHGECSSRPHPEPVPPVRNFDWGGQTFPRFFTVTNLLY